MSFWYQSIVITLPLSYIKIKIIKLLIFNSPCCVWKSIEAIHNCHYIPPDLSKNTCSGKEIVTIAVGSTPIRLERATLATTASWVLKDLNAINYAPLISLYIKKGGTIFRHKMRKKVTWRAPGHVTDNHMRMLGWWKEQYQRTRLYWCRQLYTASSEY